MCVDYLYFTEDSLYIFKSETNKISKFEINLNNKILTIEDNEIKKTYNIKYFNKDGVLSIFDENHFFSINDTINLKKIKTNYIDKKNFDILNSPDKIWVSDNNIDGQNFPNMLWFKFNNDGFLNYYTKQFSDSKITHTRNRFDLNHISNKLNLIHIHGDFTYYLISSLTKTNFTLFMYRCDEEKEYYIHFKLNNMWDKIDLNGKWYKISSFEEFELPRTISFKENIIKMNNEKFNYSLGLYNQFIHLNNGQDFRIIDFKNDTLKIELNNSVHIKEKATYILKQ